MCESLLFNIKYLSSISVSKPPFRFLFIICVFSCSLWAQDIKPNSLPDHQKQQITLLNDLLKEVKALRQAFQESMVVSNRVQAIREQIGYQRGKIENKRNELDLVKNQLQEAENAPKEEEELKEFEMEINSTSDPNLRAQMIKSYQGLIKHFEKAKVERKKEQSQLREKEIALQTQLQKEENILTELQDRLELINRQIEASMTKEK